MGLRDSCRGKADGPARARARRLLPADAEGPSREDRTNDRDSEGPRGPDAAPDGAEPPRCQGAGLHLRLHRELRYIAADRLASHGQASRGRSRRRDQARDLVVLPARTGSFTRDTTDPGRYRLAACSRAASYARSVRSATRSHVHFSGRRNRPDSPMRRARVVSPRRVRIARAIACGSCATTRPSIPSRTTSRSAGMSPAMTGRHAYQASRYVWPNVSCTDGMAKIVARAYASAFSASLTIPRSTQRSSLKRRSNRDAQASVPTAMNRASGRDRQTNFAAARRAWYPLYRSLRPTNSTVAGSIGPSGSQSMIGPTPVTCAWRTRRDAYHSDSHFVRAITASSRR